jgi:hypothetical protein
MKNLISLIFAMFLMISANAQSWSTVNIKLDGATSISSIGCMEQYGDTALFCGVLDNRTTKNIIIQHIGGIKNIMHNGTFTKNITNIKKYKGKLYIGLEGNEILDTKGNTCNFGFYDGTKWVGIMYSISRVIDMQIFKDKLYILTTDGLSTYDGTTLTEVLTFYRKLTGKHPMAIYDNELYITGRFESVTIKTPKSSNLWDWLIKFDGTKWDEVSSQSIVIGKIASATTHKNELYVSGTFYSLDYGITATFAKYNKFTNSWVMIPTPNNTLFMNDLVVSDGNDIYMELLDNTAKTYNVYKYSDGNITKMDLGANAVIFDAPKVLNKEIYALVTYDGVKELIRYNNLITSVKKETIKSNIIYPNPSTGVVNFENYDGIYSLYSSFGFLVFEGSGNRQDFSELKKGLYFIRMGNNTQTLILN